MTIGEIPLEKQAEVKSEEMHTQGLTIFSRKFKPIKGFKPWRFLYKITFRVILWRNWSGSRPKAKRYFWSQLLSSK